MVDSSDVIHSTVKIKKIVNAACSVSSLSAAIDVCWSTSFTCNDVVFSREVCFAAETNRELPYKCSECVCACVRLSLQLHPTGSLWTGTFSLQHKWWLHFFTLHPLTRQAQCDRRDTCPVWVRCVIVTLIKNIWVNIWVRQTDGLMMKIQSLLFFITFSNLWCRQRPSVTITYSKRDCKSFRVMIWICLNQCYFFQLHGSCQDLTNQ